ncbi:MAG: hypothetical protein GY859_36200, partial [Desulfobacterales bacterium]|nr:hypothetical protein [Desulfobacterales bacterium]
SVNPKEIDKAYEIIRQILNRIRFIEDDDKSIKIENWALRQVGDEVFDIREDAKKRETREKERIDKAASDDIRKKTREIERETVRELEEKRAKIEMRLKAEQDESIHAANLKAGERKQLEIDRKTLEIQADVEEKKISRIMETEEKIREEKEERIDSINEKSSLVKRIDGWVKLIKNRTRIKVDSEKRREEILSMLANIVEALEENDFVKYKLAAIERDKRKLLEGITKEIFEDHDISKWREAIQFCAKSYATIRIEVDGVISECREEERMATSAMENSLEVKYEVEVRREIDRIIQEKQEEMEREASEIDKFVERNKEEKVEEYREKRLAESEEEKKGLAEHIYMDSKKIEDKVKLKFDKVKKDKWVLIEKLANYKRKPDFNKVKYLTLVNDAIELDVFG